MQALHTAVSLMFRVQGPRDVKVVVVRPRVQTPSRFLQRSEEGLRLDCKVLG